MEVSEIEPKEKVDRALHRVVSLRAGGLRGGGWPNRDAGEARVSLARPGFAAGRSGRETFRLDPVDRDGPFFDGNYAEFALAGGMEIATTQGA